MSTIFFMPVRKGSKSIIHKNFKKFYGKPLFCWALDAVIASGTADEIFIATDSLEIEAIAKANYGNKVFVYKRKSENAKDTSASIDVVLEFLSYKNFKEEDQFILVQATSPFTSSQDFLKLKDNIDNGKHDAYIACSKLKKFRWTEDGMPLDYNLQSKPRRQDYKGFLVETGSFYCAKVGNIIKEEKLISGNIGIVELGSESLIDIDDHIDWQLGEAYMHFIEKNQDEEI